MVRYAGDGSSVDDPIVISNVIGHSEAIQAEYSYLSRKLGVRGTDWELVRQTLLSLNDRWIDQMDIRLVDGTEMTLFFDITNYWGKFG
ncbi:hypothetical protein EU538_09545 [Candidatus Thorarchaeota archaeon]|nr:MAG: hypothetical protein EU538_09545 [Candidatus Thorarchaeota archaeon]